MMTYILTLMRVDDDKTAESYESLTFDMGLLYEKEGRGETVIPPTRLTEEQANAVVVASKTLDSYAAMLAGLSEGN